ncbi:3'-5' exonuclease [Paenibacillus cremeus]|uniref:UvrD-like helicase C-terminal domain-containing protein n=1 Tax=Paenibacillus cremeus TaxID=2163881 RepID=A0A559K3A1_9BACL|nr:hypothetical protein FPZ49_28690 [Paenibacillus cremeus]
MSLGLGLGKSRGVSLMSMHRSKGLEFETVYIIGASENIVPFYTAKSPEEVAEECRLYPLSFWQCINKGQMDKWINGPMLKGVLRGNDKGRGGGRE